MSLIIFSNSQAEFIRHFLGWLTQDEENEFRRKHDAFYVDIASKKGSESN